MATIKPRKLSDTSMVTGKVRICYVNLFTPRANDKGEDKYECCVLIPKKDRATVKMVEECIAAAKALGKSSKWGGKIPPGMKSTLRDGDEERDTPEFADHYFFTARSNKKPGILDRNTDIITDSTEIYSGVFARLSLNFFPYSNESKGVAVGLNNVQKVADGEMLGGASEKAEDVFDALDEEEDDMLS